jgi:phosphoserine/homoserine phosphotransferase
MGPMPGAKAFLDTLRSRFQVVILSDTFSQFAQPLMRQLGWPTLFCHELDVAPDGAVRDYRLRMQNHKREAVRAFKALNFRTVAAGDSYNDVAMLAAADAGIFIHPPQNVAAEFPQFPVTRNYAELEAAILAAS